MKKYKSTGYFTQLEQIRKIKNKLYEIEHEARDLETLRTSARCGYIDQNYYNSEFFDWKIENMKKELKNLIENL